MTKNITVPSSAGRSEHKFSLARRLVLFAIFALGLPALSGGIVYEVYSSPAGAVSLRNQESLTRPVGFAGIVAKVKPAVIAVRVTIAGAAVARDENEIPPSSSSLNELFRENRTKDAPESASQGEKIMIGLGSGFFISADGYAVTNDHVVDGAVTVDVRTNDGSVYAAKVIGADPQTDLALIKVDGGGKFPFVKFADTPPRVGDWALAVGNPFGLGGTVTAGIVSARGRDIGEGKYDDFIQIDAPINKGNSGGPTFDIDGRVMGVNTAIYSPSGGSVGIGFAIPAETARTIIEQLKDKGRVVRGWIGVQVHSVDETMADSLRLKVPGGALVDESELDSPAAKAGVTSGDVITALNGAPLKDSRDLERKVGSMAPGTVVHLSVLRNGRERTFELKLGELPNERETQTPSQSAN